LTKSTSLSILNNKQPVRKVEHIYETVVNSKINKEEALPKIKFETKEFYEVADDLSKKLPMCDGDKTNPICYYTSKLYLKTPRKQEPKVEEVSHVVDNKKPKRFFQLAFGKEDCFTAKVKLAKKDPSIIDPYVNPADYEFRDLHPPLGQKDFRVNYLYHS